jgi:hypothetical protein
MTLWWHAKAGAQNPADRKARPPPEQDVPGDRLAIFTQEA